MQDIRWQQRYRNYQRALAQLGIFIEKQELNDLEKQGLIQAFEYTHELAWKTLADFLKERGNAEIFGSKDATREAFRLGLLQDGEVWMAMIQSRNLTSHTYQQAVAEKIVLSIREAYYPAFRALALKLAELQA